MKHCHLIPAAILFTAILYCPQPTNAAGAYAPFEGTKTDWHGFDRYDFLMDENTMEIKPAAAKNTGDIPGRRRCIVVVPKTPAPGNPWSWRGCYWDHEPQTEIELLKRGFHIAYISANHELKPDKKWDAWYAFLTEKHGLSKKPAFIGMSRGGEYAYMWATTHPDKVSCIYGDNPGGNSDNLAKLEGLAQNHVPLLHVCGSIDPILGKYSTAIENIYHQFGGRISVMIKDGYGHHPHSLPDPTPIADFIEQSVKEMANPPAMPDYVGDRPVKSYYYGLENSYRNFPKDGEWITCRGPFFTKCYDQYEVWIGFQVPVIVIAPEKEAPGRPWVFRAGFVDRDAVTDQVLLAAGFYIVVGPVGYNEDGPVLADWNKVYQHLTSHGFSKKPVMEGAGEAAGEVTNWAIANPDKVSCIYAEDPVFKTRMNKVQPLDNLAPLANAGVPFYCVSGALDPALSDYTHVLEKKYNVMGGKVVAITQDGIGRYPTGPKDTKPVVDFIVAHQGQAAAALQTAAGPFPVPPPPPKSATGRYVVVDYPASTAPGELKVAVTYTFWIPDGVKTYRGIIVHQHGAGITASHEGSTAAYDLQWQALAKKWDCALLGPCYHVLNDGDLGAAGSEYWFDPSAGSEKAFLKALGDFAEKTGHPELATVPWALWGHSAGGIWSDVMSTLHPDRIVAVYMRSGSVIVFRNRPVEFPVPAISDAVYGIPMMCSCGIKEKPRLVWSSLLTTYQEYRAKGAFVGFAPDPRTDHECGDSRYFAIPYLDACLAMRLPDKGSKDQTLKPVDNSKAWIAPLVTDDNNDAATAVAVPAADYKGDPKTSVWLPSEAVAKDWMEYIKTGAVSDTTPPPAPFNVKANSKGEQGTEITWDAEADFESGIRGFIVERDGKELARVPENPRGQFGRPLFQSMTYHDTPSQPLPEMRYLDASAKPGEKHTYTVIEINSVELKSKPSAMVAVAKK